MVKYTCKRLEKYNGLSYYNIRDKDGNKMKRVKAACITQTLHFMLKEDLGHDYAVKIVDEEVKKYKEQLERNKTQYKIVSEERQPDDSVILEIIKQYNTSPVGDYLK